MHKFAFADFGSFRVDLSTLLTILVTCIIVFVLAKLSVRNLSVENPSKMQNFMEWVVDFVHSTISNSMPLEKAKKFVSLGLTLILFIFVSNLLGLPFGIMFDYTEPVSWNIPLLGEAHIVTQAMLDAGGGHAHLAWWKSPTADFSVTVGLALVVFILIHYLGLKMNAKHYLKHYVEPFPIFLPLNLLKVVTKPLTLAIRLYANILVGEVLISTILMLKWWGIPILTVWQGFSVFVGGIQAFLFLVLTMVYISEAIVHEEH